ncbi:MAG: macro domain-containing protein [Sedimentisphaerales bacterium]|nr:macro domain-containing protein [Sedimentisphaerales bacterium]
MEWTIGQTTIGLVQGDITEQDTDAIVNAANEQLVLGGGVAGAIRKKGGPGIQAECHTKAPIQVGQAVITGGGNLKARYVIHAVGPRMGEGEEETKLENATANSLKVADDNRLQSLAFCAISTGIFGYPLYCCARIMLSTTIRYLKQERTNLERVVFCLFDTQAYSVFQKEMEQQGAQ